VFLCKSVCERFDFLYVYYTEKVLNDWLRVELSRKIKRGRLKG